MSTLNSHRSAPRARARFLTQAVQLEESDVPGVVSTGVLLTTLFVIGAIVWASMTPLNEISNTPGEVVPVGHIHKVQHLEGGIVADIHIREGDEVDAGTPLISMAPSFTKSEFDQMQARRADLELRRNRISALLNEDNFDISGYTERFQDLANKHYAFYQEQRNNFAQQIEVAESRIAQRKSALASARGQLAASDEEIGLLQQLKGMREKLAKQQIVARVDVLNSGVRLAEALRMRRELKGNVDTERRRLDEAKTKALEVRARQRETLSNEATEVSAELADIEQTLVRVQDRLGRLMITAPTRGIIKGLSVNTIGSVVEPGQVLLEVVPTTERLVVESRLSTEDVGHVRPGQTVDVKVTSFDSIRYGSIAGTLARISPSTFLDPDGKPYYRAEIALTRDFVGNQPGQNRVLPGMTVQADIITGSKTVLDYVMKPIFRGFETAFRER
ncbi:MAG: HlyD family type I secretion periplasmic adaptor subunit [Pseudomonadota bacterium]